MRLKLLILTVMAIGAARPVQAASASARVSASVVEAVNVVALLGSPVSVADILGALESNVAGPNTGSLLIRMPSLQPPPDPGTGTPVDPGMQAAMAGALAAHDQAGMLQGALAAGVSMDPHAVGAGAEAAVSITVAFN